jgi:hypothetical protein
MTSCGLHGLLVVMMGKGMKLATLAPVMVPIQIQAATKR